MTQKAFLYFLFILLPFSNVLVAQESYLEFKDSVIDFDFKNDEDMLAFIHHIKLFVGKDLDSTDIEMLLEGPILGSILVKGANEQPPTYEYVYDEFVKIKKTPNYDMMLKAHVATKQLEVTPANYSNWESDKQLFLAFNIAEAELEQIRVFVEKNSDSTKTYKELLADYRAEKETKKKKNDDSLFQFYGSIDIDSLQRLSLAQHKPILLYFTGYGCVNCRKIEENVLKEAVIYTSLQQDFIFVSLYVDSREELPEKEQYTSKFSHRLIKTIGDKNLDYEQSTFNVVYQPFFVCLTEKGDVLGKANYEKQHDLMSFQRFLTDCQKAYNN